MQINNIQDAQEILLSNQYSSEQLCQLGQILQQANVPYFARAAFSKAFYLNPKVDQSLAAYLSFLLQAGEARQAFDFLIHASVDIARSQDRQTWLEQLLQQFKGDQEWQQNLKQVGNIQHIDFLKLSDLVTFCFEHQFEYQTLVSETHLNLGTPLRNKPNYDKLISGCYVQPELAFAILPNTLVQDGSSYAQCNNTLIGAEFSLPNRDSFIPSARESSLLYMPEFRSATKHAMVKKRTSTRKINGLSISLLSSNSHTYEAFIFQILGHLVLLDKTPFSTEITALLPASISLDRLVFLQQAFPKVQFELVAENEVITQESALLFTGIFSTPLRLRSGTQPMINNNFVHRNCITSLATSIEAQLTETVKGEQAVQALFITNDERSQGHDALLASALGYECKELDNATNIEEQIIAFRQAERIVLTDLSLLPNLLFCLPNTLVFVLVSFPADPCILSQYSKLANDLSVELHWVISNGNDTDEIIRYINDCPKKC